MAPRRREEEDGEVFQPPDTVDPQFRCGQIVKVHLIDFLCHRNVTVDFGARVNFLAGRNGNGKSAILTAIQVGLGGKVSHTSRGTRVADVVNYNANQAIVSVTVRNISGEEGILPTSESYHYSKYGPTITVERKIAKRGGASDYKLRNDSGVVVSSKRSDVADMLDQFNIQLDNPSTVLSQDAVKTFLNSSDPKHKYEFFMKATQLEAMRQRYTQIYESRNMLDSLLVTRAERIPKLEEEYNEAKHEVDRAEALAQLERTIDQRKKEILWANYYELQDSYDVTCQVFEKVQGELKKLEEAEEKEKLRLADLEKEINEYTDTTTQAQDRVAPVAAAIREHQAKIRELKSRMTAEDQKHRRAAEALKRAKADQKYYEEEKEKAVVKLSQMEEQQSQRRSRVAELEGRIEELKKEYTASRDQLDQIAVESSDLEDQRRTFASEARDFVSNYRRVENEIRDQTTQQRSNARKQAAEAVRMLSDDLPRALQAIAQNHRKFSKTPIGPIGLFLRVTDEKWLDAVDNKLSNLKPAFICNTVSDAQTLMAILRTTCQRPPLVIASAFTTQVYDYQRHGLEGSFLTMMKMLAFNEGFAASTPLKYSNVDEIFPTVLNVAMDQRHVEHTVLMESIEEGTRLHNDPQKPSAIEDIQLMDGRRIFSEGRAVTIAPYDPASRRWLGNIDSASVVEKHVRQLKASLEQMAHQKKLNDERNEEFSATARELQLREKEIRRNGGNIQSTINRTQRELDAVKEDLETQQDDSIQTNDELIESTMESIEKHTKEMEDVVTRVATIKQSLETEEHEMEEKKKERDEIEEGNASKASHLQNLHGKLRQFREAVVQATGKLGRKRVLVATKAEEKEKTLSDADAAKAKAMGRSGDICPRPAKSMEDLIIDLRSVVSTLQNSESEYGLQGISLDEVRKRCEESKEQLTTYTGIISKFRDLSQIIRKALEVRVAKYNDLRGKLCTLADSLFAHVLERRQHSGRLVIDHKASNLELEINLNQQLGTGRKVENTRTLSGGERSYSTVAFLLALWGTSETPIRILDEFDVFMDEVNRRRAIELLLAAVRKSEATQLIIATPQDVSYLKEDADIRLLEVQKN